MRIEPAQRRTLLAGSVVIATILMLGKGLPAIHRWEASQLADEQSALLELERVKRLQQLDPGDRIGEVQGMRARAESGMLRAERPQDAATTLTARLESSATAMGIRVSASSAHADTAFAERFAVVSSRIVATGDIRQLANWLGTIERAAAPMRIVEMTITQPTPGAGDDVAEALQVDVVVESLVRATDRIDERWDGPR